MTEAIMKVQYLPKYVSAIYAPKRGVIHTVPTQFVTLFDDFTVPSCNSLVKYNTKFVAIP